MNTAYIPTVAANQSVPASTTSIKNLPINLFGSVMGLAGLGLAWRLSGQYFGVGGMLGEAIGALAGLVFVLLTLGYLGKWLKHPGAVKAEFNHPIASNFFGTVTIALLLLSAVAAPHSEMLGEALWILGSALTVLLAGLVVSRLLSGNQDSLNAVPAWLIPGVCHPRYRGNRRTHAYAMGGGVQPVCPRRRRGAGAGFLHPDLFAAGA